MASNAEQWFAQSLEQYQKARDLIDNQSRHDPPSHPYQSKYAGQDILKTLWDQLLSVDYEGLVDINKALNQVNLLKILLKLDMGIVAMDTEETGAGQKHLEAALATLEQITNDKDICQIVLFKVNVLNQLGFLWCAYGEHETACGYLTNAEATYKSWNRARQDDHQLVTYDLIDAFKMPLPSRSAEDTADKVEKSHTQTLYFLAQAYEKLSRNALSARYCLETLRRQYVTNDFDRVDWAINAATLAQYFATSDQFEVAANHITVARHVLRSRPGAGGSVDAGDADEERPRKAKADINRIIVKYSLMLLEHHSDDSASTADVETDCFFKLPPQSETKEQPIPFKAPRTFQAAREVFVLGQNALNEAKQYYTLDEHASDYVDCVLDNSKLYRTLAKFEDDKGRACIMHKRRIDMLEALLKELNITYFLAQCRQALFELGETYSEMCDMKMALLESKSPDQLRAAGQKINSLVQKGIEHFESFVGSFIDKKTGQMPARLDDEMVKPVCVAWFSIGRLYTKFMTSDPREQTQNWTKCELYYKKVIDYVDVHPEQEQLVRDELRLIREMIALIPKRLNMLLNATLY